MFEFELLESGGSTITDDSIKHPPRIQGKLSTIRDEHDRIYLCTSNISINEGRQQPVPFRLEKALRPSDSSGAELSVTVVDSTGNHALVEYWRHALVEYWRFES